MELQKGRPQDTTGRLAKEIRTYDLLDQLGISYERIDHAPAMTMEDCQEIDEALQATVCKNLFCATDRNGVLSVDDSGYKDVSYKGSVCADRFGKTFLCKAGIHGEVSGYHTGFCQCDGTDE